MKKHFIANRTDIITNRIKYLINILVAVYITIEILCVTIIGMYCQNILVRTQGCLGILLLMLTLAVFFTLSWTERKKWLLKNSFVWIYLSVRIITVIITGFDYTLLRSLLFEIVYLIVLTDLIVDIKIHKKVTVKLALWINLVFNICNTIVYLYCECIRAEGLTSTNSLFAIAVKYTYLDANAWYYNCSMYSNANYIGMITGALIIISTCYLTPRMSTWIKLCWTIYYFLSLYCIIYSQCSSAQVALIIVLLGFIIVKKMKLISPKVAVVACLISCVIITGCIYCFVANHGEYNEYTRLENTINNYSTLRYEIWKDSYYCHKDELLFGCGNITLEKRDRYQYNIDKGIDLGFDVNSSLESFVGPHNGYIGMISCTGIIGFITFLLLVFMRIKDSSILNKGYWYLAIVFILIINLFECMIIISKNFCCVLLFLILAFKNDDSDNNYIGE